jgi:hypothetical protein
MADMNPDEGWGFPMLSKKAHFFRNGISVCGRWMFMGKLDAETGVRSPDDCKACTKKVLKEKK